MRRVNLKVLEHLNIQQDLSQMSLPQQINLAFYIIRTKPPLKRSSQDIDVLIQVLSKLEFFEKMNIDLHQSQELCRYLNYEIRNPEDVVFRRGDAGDKFYLLLHGEVGVYLEVEAGDGDRLVNRIKAGGSFGELSMLTDAPRTASVKCHTECYLGVVNKQVFRQVLKSSKQKELDNKLAFLGSLQFLNQLRRRTLETLIFHFTPVQATRGQVMCREGEPCRFIYIIQKGQFVLNKGFRVRDQSKLQLLKETIPKKRVEVAKLIDGEMYGELDALLGQPYHFTMVCESISADLFVITKTDFLDRVMRHTKSDDMDIFLKKFLRQKVEFRNDRIRQIQKVLGQTKEFVVGQSDSQTKNKLSKTEVFNNPRDKLSQRRLNDLIYQKIISESVEVPQSRKIIDKSTHQLLKRKLRNTSLSGYFETAQDDTQQERRLKTYSYGFLVKSVQNHSQRQELRYLTSNQSGTLLTEYYSPRRTRSISNNLLAYKQRVILSRQNSIV